MGWLLSASTNITLWSVRLSIIPFQRLALGKPVTKPRSMTGVNVCCKGQPSPGVQ